MDCDTNSLEIGVISEAGLPDADNQPQQQIPRNVSTELQDPEQEKVANVTVESMILCSFESRVFMLEAGITNQDRSSRPFLCLGCALALYQELDSTFRVERKGKGSDLTLLSTPDQKQQR
jgi:hypothetical protein